MKIHNAIIFATVKHRNQKRKGSDVPYIVHPMEVMQILTENDLSEDVIVAGILHDTLEDTDTTEQEIEQNFGKKILELVKAESEDKSKGWHERKQTTIDSIKTDTLEAKQVCCADKLSNMRSIYVDLQNMGEDIWKIFKAPKDQVAWYYRSLVDSLSDLEGSRMYAELKSLVEQVFAGV